MAAQRSVLLGCGRRGETHAEALVASDQFTLDAVCDRNVEKAEDFAEAFDATAYTDVPVALDRVRPSHVSAVTAPSGRLSTVADVLEHEPSSLLIEKPVANNLDEVEQIAELFEVAGTIGTVCHQKPYADEFVAVKRWIDEGRLGEIERLVGSTKGGLAGQGTHFIHACNWLVGDDPTAVRAFAAGPIPLDPAENPLVADHAEPEDILMELSYPDDVRGFIHNGPNAPGIRAQEGTFWYEFRLDVIGTGGHAELVLGDHASGVFADGVKTVNARDFEEGAYMTRGLYDDLGSLLSGEATAHLADLDSAVTVHRIIDAAMRSAHDGRAVAPKERPPDLGRSTAERLRRSLLSRTPLCVSTLPFQSRDAAMAVLSDLGIARVDLWSVPGIANHVDPETDVVEDVRAEIDALGLSVPVVSIGGKDIEDRIAFASALGADTAVLAGTPADSSIHEPETLGAWLNQAEDHDISLSITPGLGATETIDDLTDFLDALDHPSARVALAPPLANGDVGPQAMLERLGDRTEVLYLWEAEPGTIRNGAGEWSGHADDQPSGGGTAVDFERLLEAAIEHAPGAEWVLRHRDADGWTEERLGESVTRALRIVEDARP